jgi:predicted DNA-binding transcriptional regulator AlpA
LVARVSLRHCWPAGVAISSLRSSPSPFAIALRHRDPQLAVEPGGTREDHGGSIMPDPLAGLPPRFLRTPEAARFLGLSGRTLEKHRTYGTGPKYRKIGGRVVYALDDLKAWADLGAKTSTSDPGAGTVYPAKRSALPDQSATAPLRRPLPAAR